jgi:hypothetical protein
VEEFSRPLLDVLFSNPRLTRVRILQEVALAKKLHLVFWDVCMDWDPVASILEIVGNPYLIGFSSLPGFSTARTLSSV